MGNLTTPGSKTPEPIATTLGVGNYAGDHTLTSKSESSVSAWVVSAHVGYITVS